MTHGDTLFYHLYGGVGFLSLLKVVSGMRTTAEDIRHVLIIQLPIKNMLHIPGKIHFSDFFCLHFSDVRLKSCYNVVVTMMKEEIKYTLCHRHMSSIDVLILACQLLSV